MTYSLGEAVSLGPLRFVTDAVLKFATRVGDFKRTATRNSLTIKETSCRGSIINYA